ncbi:hypothetical protein ACG7TL_004207 [Trametes sanguinea]
MTLHDIEILDTVGTLDYLNGYLSADDVDIAPYRSPSNPKESEAPPEQSVDEEEEIENGETDRDEDEEGVSEDEAEGESVLDGDDE